MERWIKDPSAEERIPVPWAKRLGSEFSGTIQTTAWVATPAGLSISGSSISGTTVSAIFKDGAVGTVYTVTNEVNLSDSQKLYYSFEVSIEEE